MEPSSRTRAARVIGVAAALATIGALLASSSATAATPTRVMTLGDSITQGLAGDLTYRHPLWKSIQGAGLSADLVGTLDDPVEGTEQRQDFDQDHDGHGGYRTDNVLNGKSDSPDGRLSQWVAQERPDIVLVHLGTNDLRQCETVASTIQDLRDVVAVLRAQNSAVTVLLAEIIPTSTERSCSAELDQRVLQLNAGIRDLGRTLDTASSQVVAVDLYTGFSKASDTVDGVHPSTSGYQKMAADFFAALRPFLASGGSTTTTTTTTTTRPPTGGGGGGGATTTTAAPSGGSPGPAPTTTTTAPAPAPAPSPAPAAGGYWLVDAAGDVVAFGGAPALGSMPAADRTAPVVALVATPSGRGYWLVGAQGRVRAFGDAVDHGSIAGPLNAPLVGAAATPSGGGYFLLGGDGGVFTFGDARFAGSTGGIRLNQPVVGMATTPAGGYWLVAADGGIFSFGPGATFLGSTGGQRLARPVVGMDATTTGRGYRLVASDGGIFTFGDARFLGSTGGVNLVSPIVGMDGARDDGYLLVARDGGIFAFGSATYAGRTASPSPTTAVRAR